MFSVVCMHTEEYDINYASTKMIMSIDFYNNM